MKYKGWGKKYWKKLLYKYRFVIMTDSSFEERLVVKLSRLNVLSFLVTFVFVFFLSALLLIAHTPLKEYVPGKSNKEVQKKLILLTLKSDSLESALDNRSVYLKNINDIISGGDGGAEKGEVLKTPNDLGEVFFEKSIADSLLRVAVETEDKSSVYTKSRLNHNLEMFFPPLSGLISNDFNNTTEHFGVDLVAKEKTRISSVLDGSVVASHWTVETGYVIIIQHKNDYLSQYKHNSMLLKQVGDFVRAGEHIAIIGNSGELSSGPHLHFELWHKGVPVNPKDYISF